LVIFVFPFVFYEGLGFSFVIGIFKISENAVKNITGKTLFTGFL